LWIKTSGKCGRYFSRRKGWWRGGKDEIATHKMTTDVWMSTKCNLPKVVLSKVQETIEAEESKDTHSFGEEGIEILHRQGTEVGLLGIYDFPGGIYATDGSNDKGTMGASIDSMRIGEDTTNSEGERKEIPPIGWNWGPHVWH